MSKSSDAWCCEVCGRTHEFMSLYPTTCSLCKAEKAAKEAEEKPLSIEEARKQRQARVRKEWAIKHKPFSPMSSQEKFGRFKKQATEE